MDYSKVNTALSGWVGSGERNRRQQSELAQVMQLAQTQQLIQAQNEKAEVEMETYLNDIKAKASQVAMRNEDVDFVQSLYDENRDIFLAELEKHGNDPVRFMNSGGRRVLRDFSKNVLHGEEAQRIKMNTSEIQKYYDAELRDNGKYRNTISHSSRQDLVDFLSGDRDVFRFKSIVPLNLKLAEEDYAGANSKAEAILGKEGNYMSAVANYNIEYDLPDDYRPSQEELIGYVNNYYPQTGSGKDAAFVSGGSEQGGVSVSVAGDMRNQYNSIKSKQVSTANIGKDDAQYQTFLSDFNLANINYNISPENTDVVGHRAFQGKELDFAKVFVDGSLDEEKGITEISNYQVNNSDGQWYDEDGMMMLSGNEMPDMNVGGIFLAYRIPDGRDEQGRLKTRLVKAEDLEEEPQNAEHVLVQEFEDWGLFNNDHFYKELKMQGQSGKMSQMNGILGKDAEYKRVQQTSPEDAPEYDSKFALTPSTSAEDLSTHVQSLNFPLNVSMGKLNIEKHNMKARSILLALSMAGNQDHKYAVESIYRDYNRDTNPELYKALRSGDTNVFFDTLLKDYMKKGASEKEARRYLTEVDKLRLKILQAQNIE